MRENKMSWRDLRPAALLFTIAIIYLFSKHAELYNEGIYK
jgi:hypothetical protein